MRQNTAQLHAARELSIWGLTASKDVNLPPKSEKAMPKGPRPGGTLGCGVSPAQQLDESLIDHGAPSSSMGPGQIPTTEALGLLVF